MFVARRNGMIVGACGRVSQPGEAWSTKEKKPFVGKGANNRLSNRMVQRKSRKDRSL
jgi:hypothetical protein